MSTPEQPGAPVPTWSWRKKLVVWGGGAGAVIAIVALLIFGLTRPLVQIADGFFEDLKSGALERAYERASNDFKRAATVDELRRHVATYDMNAIETVSWSSRSIRGLGDGSIGQLDGAVTDRNGTVRPLSMTFVKEAGVWRIQNLSLKPAGVANFGQSRDIPEERELIRMTHDVVVVFSRSLKARSLKPLHESISERWRRDMSVEALEASFKPFLEADIDLGLFEALTPVFDSEPSIDANGWLVVTGHYETSVDRLDFEQSFIYEGLGWKLGGLSVNIKPKQ